MQLSPIFGSTVASDADGSDIAHDPLGARFVHPYHGAFVPHLAKHGHAKSREDGLLAGALSARGGDKVAAAEPTDGVTEMANAPSPTVGVVSPAVSPSAGTSSTSGIASASYAVNPATITSVTLPGHLTVNLELDAAAQAAPSYYAADFQVAANLISNAIADPITVNITVDVSGTGGGAQAGPTNGAFVDYSTVRSILATRANTPAQQAAVASLPTGSMIQGQSQVIVWNAQEKAFGELSATDPGIDGNAMFASDIADGQLVGVALHELTHAMGRTPAGSSSQPQPDILDLFRFTSAGNRYFSSAVPASPSYFSLDGGMTDIADYGQNSDPSDFLNPPASNRTPNDPFNESYDTNTQQTFTAIDLEQLEALGFNVVCFASGTLIRTACGDVAVDDLKAGDRVVTASGDTRPIRWLGHRTIACRKHPRPHDVKPIRIMANAFGVDLPARDLFLSPGHPVLVGADADGEGGHLVPIMCLVNGTTIERVDVDTVTYWHVELDQHDILLAEGLAAESYLDWGDRAFFTHGSDDPLANPDFVVPGLAGRCRPVATDGPVVESERRRLDAVLATRLESACAWPALDISW